MNLARRPFRPGVLTLAATLALPAATTAQLRPYEPFDWAVFDPTTMLSASAGAAMFWDQRASLAGTAGRLSELGTFSVLVRSGRIAVGAAGTAYRILVEKESFAPPEGDVEQKPLGDRRDAGDHRISTAILLTDAGGTADAILRFGTRLPTTDNQIGLERDATDFFALVGGRIDRGPLRATAEIGVGIHGTRLPQYEQSDVLVYLLGLGLPHVALRPSLLLLGHSAGTEWSIRGNEALSELRLRLQTAGRVRLQVEAVRGLARFSPGGGLIVSIGTIR